MPLCLWEIPALCYISNCVNFALLIPHSSLSRFISDVFSEGTFNLYYITTACLSGIPDCLAIYLEPDLSVSASVKPFHSWWLLCFRQKFKHSSFLSGARAVNQNHGILKSPCQRSRGAFFNPSSIRPDNADTDTLTPASEDRAGSH